MASRSRCPPKGVSSLDFEPLLRGRPIFCPAGSGNEGLRPAPRGNRAGLSCDCADETAHQGPCLWSRRAALRAIGLGPVAEIEAERERLTPRYAGDAISGFQGCRWCHPALIRIPHRWRPCCSSCPNGSFRRLRDRFPMHQVRSLIRHHSHPCCSMCQSGLTRLLQRMQGRQG